MKLCVFSDPHGYFPTILDYYDVVCCCGDFSPLQYQRSYSLMIDWIKYDFCKWIKSLNCKKFIFIAGNHDFCCEKFQFKEDLNLILEKCSLSDKVVYLENESYTFEGKKFFGCPYSDIPNWAFSAISSPEKEGGYYALENNVDVFLVHQAPDYNEVGTSYYDKEYGRNFGSIALLKIIDMQSPKYVFCGHIHTGRHDKTVYNNTIIYNTSIKDEQYKIAYEPLRIEI